MIVYSKVTSQPGVEPVTLTEAKVHLRVDSTDDDAYINTLISVTRQLCESYTGLSFITQTRRVTMDRFPYGSSLNPYACIYLPYGPVKEVIPYLIRRTKENSSVGGQMSRELGLIEKELARRRSKNRKLYTL